MPQHILLLHSSCDTTELQDLERHAGLDLRNTDWQIWIDRPDSPYSATLSAAGPFEPQIRQRIADAFAVVFVVGSTGPGDYQLHREAPWIMEAIQARLSTPTPLRLVPLLLREGRESHLPDWMQQYTIVNKSRDMTPVSMWREIFRLIEEEAPLFDPGFKPVRRPPELSASVDAVTRAFGDPRCLTVLIGPYGDQSAGHARPAALTERLLRTIKLNATMFQPWLPWPAEAAEWVRLGGGPNAVEEVFRGREFVKVSQEPAELMHQLAHLAKRWSARSQRQLQSGQQRTGWNGLVLLNTRVDLALEFALYAAGVSFTRLVPSARNGDLTAQQARMYQEWQAGGSWKPLADLPEIATDLAVTLEGGATLAKLSLEQAKPVLVVKLFGSLDIDGSLVTTSTDLFKEATGLSNMPKQMLEAIKSSPQLLVGHGLASPAAQLARQFVLGERNKRKPRILVAPRAHAGLALVQAQTLSKALAEALSHALAEPEASNSAVALTQALAEAEALVAALADGRASEQPDSLSDLEHTLFNRFADQVREAMDLSAICWSDPATFMSELADRV